MVDSDSTRTESCAAIRSDPGAQMQVDGLKAADRNGSQKIIHPPGGAGGSENPVLVSTPGQVSWAGPGAVARNCLAISTVPKCRVCTESFGLVPRSGSESQRPPGRWPARGRVGLRRTCPGGQGSTTAASWKRAKKLAVSADQATSSSDWRRASSTRLGETRAVHRETTSHTTVNKLARLRFEFLDVP
jgi:hypothetical protein